MSKWHFEIGWRQFGWRSSSGCWTRRVACSGNGHISALSANWLRRKRTWIRCRMNNHGVSTINLRKRGGGLYAIRLLRTINWNKAWIEKYQEWLKDISNTHKVNYTWGIEEEAKNISASSVFHCHSNRFSNVAPKMSQPQNMNSFRYLFTIANLFVFVLIFVLSQKQVCGFSFGLVP